MGVLGIGGVSGARALNQGGDAVNGKCRGGALRTQVIQTSPDERLVGVGEGGVPGKAEHADAVGLRPGAKGIGVLRVGAGAADVGGGEVHQRRVAEEAQEASGFMGEINHRVAVLERLIPHGAGPPLHVARRVLVPALEIGVDEVEAEGELLVHEHPIEIGREPLGAAVVVASLHLVAVIEASALGSGVDRSRGVGVTIRDAAGPARNLHPL